MNRAAMRAWIVVACALAVAPVARAEESVDGNGYHLRVPGGFQRLDTSDSPT